MTINDCMTMIYSGENESTVHRDAAWVIRKLWNQYRLGSVDEVAIAIKLSILNRDNSNNNNKQSVHEIDNQISNSNNNDNFEIQEIDNVFDTKNVKISFDSINIIAAEAKQFMNTNACEILITDVTSYAVRVYKYQYQLMDKSSSSLSTSPALSLSSISSPATTLLTPNEMKVHLMDEMLPKVIKLLHQLSISTPDNPSLTATTNISNSSSDTNSTGKSESSQQIKYINFNRFSQIMQRLFHRLAHTIISSAKK